MTVVLVIFGALDRRSGGFRYDSELADALRRRGHRVRVVSQRWSPRYTEQLAQGRDRAWVDEVTSASPDLVLVDELNHASTAAGLPELRRRLGPSVPITAIVHHLRSDERPGRVRGRREERRFLRRCDAWLCNGITTLTRVTAVSRTIRSSAVVMPGRDDPRIIPSAIRDSPSREGIESSESGLRVLAVGTPEPRKNLDALIRAIAAVPAASLTVVGSLEVDPAYVRRLKRVIARLRVAHRVTLRGRVTDGELARCYRDHQVFALPSRYEGFGIVYLEAMERGLPVIATSRGGARDLVRHGVDGFLVDPRSSGAIAAAILALATDPNLRRRLGESARNRAVSLPTWSRAMDGAVCFLEAIA